MKTTIVCAGDSLTRGGVGWSYIHFSAHRSEMVNAGRDGDTVWGLSHRLPDRMADLPPDSICVLSVGTNDSLVPHMATQFGWRLVMGLRSRLMHCERDDQRFLSSYRELVGQVQAAEVHPIIVGLPLTEMRDYPDDEHTRRSELLRGLATALGCPFVDAAAAMAAIPAAPGGKRFRWFLTALPRFVDAIMMAIAPVTKDWFARARGLTLTVDGIHWTSASARAIAAAIDEAIDEAPLRPTA